MTTISPAAPTGTNQVDALNTQAWELRHRNTTEALRLSCEAHALALQLDYQQGLCHALLRWSLCEYILGQPPAAVLGRLHASLSLAEALGDQRCHIDGLNLLAAVQADCGEQAQSLQTYAQCAALAEQLDDQRLLGRSLGNMALVHRALGQYPQALDLLERYLALAEQVNDSQGQTYALANLGELLSELGEHEAALQSMERSLASDPEGLDLARRATTLLSLGRLRLKHADETTALAHMEESVALSRQTGNLRDLCDALHGLAQAHQVRTDLAAAQAALQEAHALALQADDLPRMNTVLLTQGRLLMQQGQEQAALELLQQVLPRCEGLQATALSAQAHEMLSEIAQARQDYRLALQHFHRFHELQQQLHGAQAQQHLRGLMIRSHVQRWQRQAEDERSRSQALSSALEAARQADDEKQRLLQQLSAQTELLHQLSREDGLTGVANRRWLDLQLSQELERALRFGHPLSIAMLDLDHFKSINDRFTHLTGDKVLRRVAQLLRNTCRRSDLVARYGGEEFMLVLIETPLEKARLLCEKLRMHIASHDWRAVHPDLDEVTVSVGLATRRDKDEVEALSARADAQLYQAKHQGRNRVCADED